MLGNEVCSEEGLWLFLYPGRILACKHIGDTSKCISS